MKTLNLKTPSHLAAAFVGLVSFNLQAAMLYVSLESPNPSPPFATWTTAATNIQQAVAAALPGDEIVVTNGVYRTGTVETTGPSLGIDGSDESLGLSRVALTNAVMVRSVNGPEVTVIEGSQSDPATGQGLDVRCVSVGKDSILSGFLLTKGGARSGESGSWLAGKGGGILSGGPWLSPCGIVTNCVFQANTAESGGGAFGGKISNCTLANNSATVEGGAAYFCTLEACRVIGNRASGGGGVYNCSVIGSILAGNKATDQGGAALAGGQGDCLLYSCTITDNEATGIGGGTCRGRMSGVFLHNCIVTSNRAAEGANYDGAGGQGPDIQYSCTSPLPDGPGNIDADPRFVDAAHGDLRLLPDSPCIDAGTNLTESISTDILGLPRPLDGNGDGIARFDMGAYEFNPYRFEPVLHVTPNGLEFTVRGEPGRTVRIERSRDLVNWELVATVPIPVSGQTLIDPTATSEPCLFYRAVAVP